MVEKNKEFHMNYYTKSNDVYVIPAGVEFQELIENI